MSTLPLIPLGVVEVRRETCARCPTPCTEFTGGKIAHAEPCATCPASPRRWSPYGRCQNYAANYSDGAPRVEIAQAHVPFGLGDAVAAVAQPIAGVLDRALGTNIQGCGGCKQRQAALNKLVPDLKL